MTRADVFHQLLTTFVQRKSLPFEQAVNGQEAVDAYIAAPASFCCLLMGALFRICGFAYRSTLTRDSRHINARHGWYDSNSTY
jgi:hypothetical protein